jgi:hypothetical protein
MTLRQYILLMLFGTAIAGAALFQIITSVSPDDAGTLMFVLFYVALFCVALGIATILGLLVRMFLFADAHSIPQKVELAFRQGILMGCLATAALILKGNDMLTWWNSIMLVGAVSSIEMAFMGLSSR